MVTFIDGLKVKKQDFQSGDYIFKLNIDYAKFVESIGEFIDDKGYVNIDICKSKATDKWYAKLNEWKPKNDKYNH